MVVKSRIKRIWLPATHPRFDWEAFWEVRQRMEASCHLCHRDAYPKESGHCGWALYGRSTSCPDKAVITMPIDKRRAAAEREREEVKPLSGGILSGCPMIWEYLTNDTYSDGSSRRTSQLTLSLYDGMPRVALNDLDLKQSVYTQAEDFDTAIQMMEHAIEADAVRWYKWDSGAKGKRK